MESRLGIAPGPVSAPASAAVERAVRFDAPRPDGRRTHVLMITEGAYPHYLGGVGVWCDRLINDLPNIDFTVMSLVGDPLVQVQYNLPANVVAQHKVPLWGMREVLEIREDLGFSELIRRRAATTEGAVTGEFVPAFRQFLAELYAATCNHHRLADALHSMHRFFLVYDFDTTFRTQAVWDSFAAAAAELYSASAAEAGHRGMKASLADLTSFMSLLYRWLIPISQAIPRADVVHAVSDGLPGLAAMIAKLEYGMPFLLTEHGIYLRERYLVEAEGDTSFFVKFLSLRTARRITELSYLLADQISPGSNYNQRWELAEGAPPQRLKTIYNGVDPDSFQPVPRQRDVEVVIVWVGRITPIKDVLTLLQAAAKVHENRPNVEFRLYGTAPKGSESYYEVCRALPSELGIDDAVVFGGFAPSAEDALNEGDIVVLSSISEGFPYSVIEAMLCARPVVATAVGGVPEALEGCGMVVEPRSPEAMAEAIVRLIDDPELRSNLGHEARLRAVARFNLRQCAEAYEYSFNRLVEVGPLPMHDPATQPPTGTTDADHSWLASLGLWRSSAEPGAAAPLGPAPDDPAIVQLAEQVSARMSRPVDSLEVTAVLESMGLNDEVAQTRYGAEDVFRLGALVLQRMLASGAVGHVRQPRRPESRPGARSLLADYMRGPMALLPVLVLLGIIAAYRELGHFGQSQILAFSVGMTTSMFVTNCFVQAMARRGAIYVSRLNFRAGRRFLVVMSAIAMTTVVGLAGLALAVGTGWGMVGSSELAIFAITFVALATVWLLGGILSVVQRSGWLGIALGIGLGVGVAADLVLSKTSGVHLLIASGLGLAVALAIMVRAVQAGLRTGRKPDEGPLQMPSPAYLTVEATPYFAYGAIYMAFILLPHLLGWLGAVPPGISRIDAGTTIELAFTVGLVPLILAGGVVENAARSLWALFKASQARVQVSSRGQFTSELWRFYGRHFARYMGSLLGLSVALASCVLWLRAAGIIDSRYDVAIELGAVAVIGYVVLGWGLFNTLFALSLGRPKLGLRALYVSIAVTLGVGLPLCLVSSYRLAPVAFVAGALTFALATLRHARTVFAAGDYYYYSSF